MDQAIHDHCTAVVSVLDDIYAKSLKTLFRNDKARIEEFNAKLEDLRDIAAGDLLVYSSAPDGTEIMVRFVSPGEA